MSALPRQIDDATSTSVGRSIETLREASEENGVGSGERCAHHPRDEAAEDGTEQLRTNNGTVRDGVHALAKSQRTASSTDCQKLGAEYRYVSVGGSLIPPTNFGIVEEDLYRSGMPNELNFPFLERLQLRTIIYLASDEVSDKLHDFIDDQEINLLQLFQDDDVPTPWKPISEETVLAAMELLLNTSTYPVYIMCSQGRHRTGTVVGCLRKLQRWSLSSIFDEYHRHADGKGRLVNEQFIELFDTDLINIPFINRPKWLR